MARGKDDFAGRVVVMTGASSGFGRGAAIELVRRGAHVVLAARRGEALDALVAELDGEAGRTLAIVADVSRADDVQRLARSAIARFGHIDVWVNNVGVGALGMFWDIPIADHARIIDVNLKGLIYGAHVALNHFRGRGSGVLVNIGSIDSEVPLAYQASYAASKAAVLSLSRSLNEELRLNGLSKSIGVATIMPWAVDTPWWLHAANYTGHQPRMAGMDDPQIVIDAIVEACRHPREEMPVGWKAKASNLSHHIFPDLTERLSADIADREARKAAPLAPTEGAIYEPMEGTARIHGQIVERMRAEDRGRPLPPAGTA